MWTFKHNLPTSCNRKCCNLGSIWWTWHQKSPWRCGSAAGKSSLLSVKSGVHEESFNAAQPETRAECDSGQLGRHKSTFGSSARRALLRGTWAAWSRLSLPLQADFLGRVRPFDCSLWFCYTVLKRMWDFFRPTRKLSQILKSWRNARNLFPVFFHPGKVWKVRRPKWSRASENIQQQRVFSLLSGLPNPPL